MDGQIGECAGRRGNQALAEPLSEHEKGGMIESAAEKLEELFDVLRIDYRNDHNTRDTPRRVAKMLVQETLNGRYADEPDITSFENYLGYDNLIVTGPIEIRSTCAHHFMPIYGSAYIGVVPGRDSRIIGLSKYDRIVRHFSARLQIQEELLKQIESFLIDRTHPDGLAIRLCAVHMCKTHRGVQASHASRMVSTTFYGRLKEPALQAEFLSECSILER